MNKKSICFYLIIILQSLCITAQTTLMGTLRDKKTKDPIAFANILINNSKKGTISDINGKFSINDKGSVETLYIKCMGYKDLVYKVPGNKKTITIELEHDTRLLPEIVIKPGINPADRIIQEVINNRKSNDFMNLNSFKYFSYNKAIIEVAFDGNEAEKAIIKKQILESSLSDSVSDYAFFDSVIDSTYLFFTESVNEYKYRSPNKINETVIASRTVGTKNPIFSLILTQMQSASFYKNRISILGTSYINPISKGTFKRYYFEIQDTILAGPDTLFGISFRPLMHTNFKGLKGKLFINTDRYAIQNVIAEPVLKNNSSLINMNLHKDTNSTASSFSIGIGGSPKKENESDLIFQIKHSYHRDSGNIWFPKQYYFELGVVLSKEKHLVARFTTQNDISNVLINPMIKRREFSDVVMEVDEFATEQDNRFWNQFRDTLSLKEKNTFRLYDSINAELKRENINLSLDRLIEWLSAYSTGRISIKMFDINLNRLVSYNGYEHFRWGLGLETNSRLVRWMSIGGYFGYGVQDHGWKYGGNLNFYLDQYKNYSVELKYIQDIIAAANTQLGSYNLFHFSSNIDYTLNRFQSVRRAEARINMPIIPYLKGSLVFRYSREGDLFTNTELIFPEKSNQKPANETDFAELTLQLNWKYKQNRIRTPKFEFNLNSFSQPEIKMEYTRGFSLFDAQTEFNRIIIEYQQQIMCQHYGSLSLFASLGYVTKGAPYSRLFNTIGTKNIWYFFHHSFLTLHPYSFTSTEYANVCIAFHSTKQFWSTKYSKPTLSLQLNSIIGSSRGLTSVQDIQIQAPERGILEPAIYINNLYTLNKIIQFGLGYAYHISSYKSTNELNNMALFFTLGFNLADIF